MGSDRESKPRPAIEAYLEDEDGSRIQVISAMLSTVCLDEVIIQGHRHGAGESNIRSTTSVGVQGSGMTTNGSLPRLTVSSGSAADSSVASSVGCRQILVGRVLESDPDNGDVLVADPQPRLVNVLECLFKFLGCPQKSHDDDDWIRHSLSHFRVNGRMVTPPTSNKCCFCSKEFRSTNGYESWRLRMEHIKLHHEYRHRLARPDFDLYRYLWEQKLIDRKTYRDLSGGQNGNGIEPTEEFPDDSSHSDDQAFLEPVSCLNERRRRRTRR